MVHVVVPDDSVRCLQSVGSARRAKGTLAFKYHTAVDSCLL